MVSAFACAGSFSNQEEYDLDELLTPCSTPKRSRKSNKDLYNKNPYANRGLDKFSKLLAELEGKKQKIYTQKGSEDISFVRFVYSGSDKWRPIVVKSKDRKMEKEKEREKEPATACGKTANLEAVQEKPEIEEEVQAISGCVEQCKIKEMIKLGNVDLRHPYFYLPLVMLFILMLLTVYGRSFAILCTSLGWYLVPMIKERNSSSRSSSSSSSEKPVKVIKKLAAVNSVITTSDKSKNKKDYTRRHSDKNIARSSSPGSSPKSVLAGPVEKSTGGRHFHKKSW